MAKPMEERSLEWSGLVTGAVAPFLAQAGAPEPSPFDRPASACSISRLFSYAASGIPSQDIVGERWTAGDLVVESVSYATGPRTRASALVVRPGSAAGLLPGLVLLHCHSGVFRWGKEKVCATPGESEGVRQFRDAKYGGRSLAHDLAARGFVVVAPDAFYFGARAVGTAGPGECIEMDRLRGASEGLVAKVLTLAGHSWPAIIAWEDRQALEYLCRRPDVDSGRIGCLGLSLGGFRAALLAARDRRVGAVVTAGWLTTAADLLAGHITRHSWMVLPSGLLPDLDLPDIAAAAHPAAFLALLCSRDHLFTRLGMQAAVAELERQYRAAEPAAPVAAEFHDVPHSMTAEMQDRAGAWMEKFLVEQTVETQG